MLESSARFTVAICSNGKSRPNLEATLGALRAQTIGFAGWDLLLVDNGATPPLVAQVDLSWHPSARVIVEPVPGISLARQCAMRAFLATRQELLVFLDDDNVANPDFLEVGLEIAVTDLELGSWGGQLLPRFGAPPPSWIGPFLKSLAVFPLDRELRTTEFVGNYDVVPPTAGMWLRRAVAAHYLQLVEQEPLRTALGGTREYRIGAEDMDIALGALDLGYTLARTPRLTVTHIIPAERLSDAYLAVVLRGIAAGTHLLEAIRFGRTVSRSWWSRWRDRWRAFRLPARQRLFFNAELDGEAIAVRLLRAHGPLRVPVPLQPSRLSAARR